MNFISYLCKMRAKTNFQYKDIFRYRFKREPKDWSIEDLHSLWLKVKERNRARQKVYWDLIREAGETLPGEGTKQVYYHYIGKDGKESLRSFRISFDKSWRGWSIGHETVKFENRDEKLAFWIADETNFEFGRKIFEAQKFTSGRLEGLVYSVLIDEINKALNEKFKSLKENPPKSFTIILGGKEYIIITDRDRGYGYSYNNFILSSEKETISL